MLVPDENFWVKQPLWERPGNSTPVVAFLLAGGPSLRGFDPRPLLRHGHLVAINGSARMCIPHARPSDVLFFADNHWFETHRADVDAWPGMVFSTSRHAKRALPGRIHYPQTFECSEFKVPGKVRNGHSSGHMALSIAIELGATRIVLLGYDMRLVVGADGALRSHHHDDYLGMRPAGAPPEIYANEFIPAFKGWHEAALRAGVEVVNATPGSALDEFPRVDLGWELKRMHDAGIF